MKKSFDSPSSNTRYSYLKNSDSNFAKTSHSVVPAFFRVLVLLFGCAITASIGTPPMSSLGNIIEDGTWSNANRSRSTSPTSKVSSSVAAAYASKSPPSCCFFFQFWDERGKKETVSACESAQQVVGGHTR
jgi:hypothetical protein